MVGRGVHASTRMRPGDLLELPATCGLNPEAVGRTRLRVGEGIVGIAAATGDRAEPARRAEPSRPSPIARRPARTRSPPCSPCRCAGPGARSACWPCRTGRRGRYERRRGRGAGDGRHAAGRGAGRRRHCRRRGDGVAATLPRQFAATPLAPGLAIGPVVLHGMGAPVRRLLADDPGAGAGAPERRRRPPCARRSKTLIETSVPDWRRRPRGAGGDAAWSRPTAAGCAGCARRSRAGCTAEAAVQRVSSDVRDACAGSPTPICASGWPISRTWPSGC